MINLLIVLCLGQRLASREYVDSLINKIIEERDFYKEENEKLVKELDNCNEYMKIPTIPATPSLSPSPSQSPSASPSLSPTPRPVRHITTFSKVEVDNENEKYIVYCDVPAGVQLSGTFTLYGTFYANKYYNYKTHAIIRTKSFGFHGGDGTDFSKGDKTKAWYFYCNGSEAPSASTGSIGFYSPVAEAGKIIIQFNLERWINPNYVSYFPCEAAGYNYATQQWELVGIDFSYEE